MSLTQERLEKIVRDLFIGVFSQKNFDLIDSLLSEDAIIYTGRKEVKGRNKIKDLIIARSQAIPDFQFTLDDVLTNGNKVAIRWHATGHVIQNIAGFQKGHVADYWGVSMWEINEEGYIIKDWYNSSTVDIFGSITSDEVREKML